MKMFEPLPKETELSAKTVVDAAYKVHTTLGPGLLESIYETCLTYELRKRKIGVETQVMIPVVYDGVRMDGGLRIDMVVGKQVLVEIKAVEQMNRALRHRFSLT